MKGHVTPESDEAAKLGSVGGFKEQGKADSRDCAEVDDARKLIDTATARAALMGIEARELEPGAWLLHHANGATIGAVRGLQALTAAVAGFEAAAADVRELVKRMGGST